jgi:RNA polymerase sigma-70 factor (ECF subfamily)
MQGIREWAVLASNEAGAPAEAALVACAKTGDREAASRLLAPHERALHLLCLSMTGSREEAEDACQETFLRALRSLNQFRADSTFRTWLFRIAVNVCLEWRRRRRPLEPISRKVEAQYSAPSPEGPILASLELLDALSTLLPRHRAIWVLKEAEGWSLDEIGASMGWNRKRVQNELFKARKTLAEWRERNRKGGER